MTVTFLFDLDMTLLDSSSIAHYRSSKDWNSVRNNMGSVKPFAVGTFPPHELPARLSALGYKTGIVTSSPRGYAESLIKSFSIYHDVLVAYHDTAEHKPDPAPIQKAMELLSVTPAETLYVGDEVIDVEASYNAGVQSIGAGWGVLDFDAFSYGAPDILFMSPDTLLKTTKMVQRRYFADVFARNKQPTSHQGSVLPCGDAPTKYALGRYFARGDIRSAKCKLSDLILKFKDDDSPVEAFSGAMSAFLERLIERKKWQPDHIVSVPPKPSQTRNRFEALMVSTLSLYGKPLVYNADGLTCVREVANYKTLGPTERSAAIHGAFATKYSWADKRVLLVDDVLTTGGTTSECVRVLQNAGAAEVRVVALARDQRNLERKVCPRCGQRLVIRVRGWDQTKFWACSAFKNYGCTYTASL